MDRKRNEETVARRCRDAKLKERRRVDSLYSLNFLPVFLGISVMLASCAKPLACPHVAAPGSRHQG